MLQILLCLTLAARVLSGATVLAMGNWHPYQLKQAGVIFSTLCALYLFHLRIFYNIPDTCSFSVLCDNYLAYASAQNVAFIIFHIACGRDAIRLKHSERRKVC